MDESRTILEESANKLFAGFAEPALLRRVEAGEAAPEVWAAIEAMGFELIFSGASDDPWRDAAVILKACGRHVLPAPLPETLWMRIGNWPVLLAAVAALLAAIRHHFPARLPACQVQGADSFALTRRHAQRYVADRVVLLGDAAHTIHPLAGQGVNLGFKDVELLCQLIVSAYQAGEAWDAPALLARYQRQRQRDNLLMQTAMDAFYWAFSNQLPPLRLLRNAGLLLADRAGPLKRRALRYALGL